MSEDRVFVTGASTVVGDVSTHDAMRLFSEIYAHVYRTCTAMDVQYDCPLALRNPRQEPTDTVEDREQERTQIQQARLLLAYVGQPSLAVGAHLAIAEEAGVPILLLVNADRRAAADKLRRTIKDVWDVISFATSAELDQRLAELLFRFFSRRNFNKAAAAQRHRWTLADYQERKAQLEAACEELRRDGSPRKPIAVEDWERSLQLR